MKTSKQSLRHLVLLTPLLLGACALLPPPKPAPFVAPEAPARFKEDGLWKHAAMRAPADTVPETWWQLFGDPVLDDLQARLVIGNENLKSAAAQVASARAALQASDAARLPTLGATANATRSGSPTTSSNGNGGVTRGRSTDNSLSLSANAAWEIDLWGRLAGATNVASARLQASEDDLAALRLSAQATLVQGYLTLRAAEAQQALLERNAATYQRVLEITQARREAGVVSQSDVLQAQTQLKGVQVQAAESALQRAQAEHAIAVLLGQSPSALDIPRSATLPALPAVPLLLPSTLLERRPDIAAAERNVAAAWAQIGVADAAFFPSLTLSASAGVRGAALGGLLNASNLLWSLGPTLAAQIFDSGQRQLASAQARASADQAASAYRQTVLTAFQEVEDNLVTLDQLATELALQGEAQQAARRNLEIVQDQYRAGTVGFLNVASAQTAALNAEATVISLRNRQLAAANQLLKNIGGRAPA